MKRFHVHVAVENIDTSVRFYSQLFAVPGEPNQALHESADCSARPPGTEGAARGDRPYGAPKRWLVFNRR